MKLFLVFILLSQLSFGQSAKSHGTLISAAICKDGILFYSDSRAAWFADSAGLTSVYAYTDSIKKIFPIGKFHIGIAGSGQLIDDTWGAIIGDFNKSDKIKSDDALLTFRNFYTYIKKRFVIEDSIIFSNYYCIAGYEEERPIVLTIREGKLNTNREIGQVFYSEPQADMFRLGFLKTNRLFDSSVDQTIKMMDLIYRSAYRQVDYMGGPIYSLKIQPKSKVVELTTFKPLVFKTYSDYERAILDGRVKVEYESRFNWAKQRLFELLRKDLNISESN